MNCAKCQDRGFTEQNHGLLMIICDCEKGQAVKAALTGETPNDNDSGAEPDTRPIGSNDTSEPEQPKKPRKKKTTRKRAK